MSASSGATSTRAAFSVAAWAVIAATVSSAPSIAFFMRFPPGCVYGRTDGALLPASSMQVNHGPDKPAAMASTIGRPSLHTFQYAVQQALHGDPH